MEMCGMPSPSTTPASKAKETRLFLFLVVCLFPLLSVAIVGGYGFLIWILQIFTGPPGPPG
jgi:nitrate reductase NapE